MDGQFVIKTAFKYLISRQTILGENLSTSTERHQHKISLFIQVKNSSKADPFKIKFYNEKISLVFKFLTPSKYHATD
jgi:tRNA U34 2-thiouridine synthase MnmA/TrmU